MASITIPVHSAIIDWVLQNIPEEQPASEVTERLNAWKSGEKTPTLNQLEEMSRKTHIPFGYFFLQTPPQENVPLVEYRTVGSAKIAVFLLHSIKASCAELHRIRMPID